jgi:hypothetical protein
VKVRIFLSALAMAAMLGASALAAEKPDAAAGAVRPEPKLVLVTFDGVRWEDVFRGADPKLAADAKFVEPDILSDWVKPAWLDPANRREALMPFVHGVVAKDGVVLGDRDVGECAHVANDMWFSYPGYNELLTGRPDPRILENDDIPNPNVTFLEFLNRRPDFQGRVEAVGTWTLFPNIINSKRSGVPVNAELGGRYPTDVQTARFALEAVEKHKPRVLYVAFGDTDELAHAGDYDQYLSAIERGDAFLRLLWDRLQADPFYRDQTTLIVTTDHGRGHEPLGAWRDHSAVRYHQLNPDYQPEYNKTGVIGSDNVWFAAMGPAVVRSGAADYRGKTCAESRQVAASALQALGQDWRAFDKGAGAPFAFIAKAR